MIRIATITIGFAFLLSFLFPLHVHASTTGITWPKQQALPTFADVNALEVVDVVGADGDIKLLLATLQGVINRTKPRIYLIESTEEGKYTWLRGLNVPFRFRGFFELVERYRNEIKGIIVYDPMVPDSINVATTLAGLHDAIVASPELAVRLQDAPYNMKVIDDLRGKFKGRLDAYRWQYDNLWHQTTQRMLIGLSPGTSIRIPEGILQSFKTIAEEETQERNARNRKTYELDLSAALGERSVYLRFDDAFPEDGWGPSVHQVTVKADGQTIAQFIPGTPEEEPFLYDRHRSQVSAGFGGHRFADHDRYFVYRFTPPEGTKQLVAAIDMWNQFKISLSSQQPLSSEQLEPYGYLRDYAVANRAMVFWLDSNVPEERALFERILSDAGPGTPYLGWFSNDVVGEFSGVELTSRYGVYVLAADWFSNLTVFSGTRPNPTKARRAATPKLENKIYVTFVYSEGDNLQYNQHRMRVLWNDPNRGKVPINWTSSPLLYESAPAILNYYQETATENDLLIAGPSGVGYFYPNAWPESSFSEFLKSTRSYLEKTGMTIPYVLNRMNGINLRLNSSVAAAYEHVYNAQGLFLSWGNRHGTYVVNNSLPVSMIQGIGSVQEGVTALANAKARWDGRSPMFVSLGLLAWNLTPTDVVAITRTLGPEYEVLLADQYFALMREAFGLPENAGLR